MEADLVFPAISTFGRRFYFPCLQGWPGTLRTVPFDTGTYLLQTWSPIRPQQNQTIYNNAWDIKQFEQGHNSILMRKRFIDVDKLESSRVRKTLLRAIAFGSDHAHTLPLL
ncbi:hypothetical protein N7453_010271 [Penicillium expansum]|nr:hypothetical protein N7453_010271 [Penicillium expansum]